MTAGRTDGGTGQKLDGAGLIGNLGETGYLSTYSKIDEAHL
ncbi:hypothetical protein [uncultured Cohaesibacter sp.]|nr:hypothetical protein [uncultured Cohaesibacter sp.]